MGGPDHDPCQVRPRTLRLYCHVMVSRFGVRPSINDSNGECMEGLLLPDASWLIGGEHVESINTSRVN